MKKKNLISSPKVLSWLRRDHLRIAKNFNSFTSLSFLLFPFFFLFLSFFFSLCFLDSTAIAQNQPESNIAWAEAQQQKNYKDQKNTYSQSARNYAKNLQSHFQENEKFSDSKNSENLENIENPKNANFKKDEVWAKIQLLKAHPVSVDQSNVSLKTKNGINIDQLISRYANHMPSAESVVNQKFQDLLIFVSFSMPEESLKQWMSQAKDAGGVLVIRGLVDNSFKKTATSVQKLIGEGQGGVEVDPTLFKRFGIKTVPAVVVLSNNVGPCLNPKGCLTPPFDVVYGDVSLSQALTAIESKGEVSKLKASLILTHMGEHS